MSDITRFGVSIDGQLRKKSDEHIKRKGYSTRFEAILDMIRDGPVEKQCESDKHKTVGTIIIVYNHI